MALDFAALKAKLDKFNRVGGGQTSESLWRPTEGKHTIRIVPWIGNKTYPFIELQFHYLGNKTILSPTSFGRRDPIAEFGESLLGNRSKEEWNEAKQFLPQLRTYVPIIVRGEEDKGVRFFSFGKTVYKQLLEMIADPDIGDITSIEGGRDLTVTYVPKEKSDTNYAKTTVLYKPNITPLSADKELMKLWLTTQPDVASLYTENTYSELKTILEIHLDPDSVVRNPPEEPGASAPTSVTEEVAAPVIKESTDSALDEFERLFKTDKK